LYDQLIRQRITYDPNGLNPFFHQQKDEAFLPAAAFLQGASVGSEPQQN
jgi:hypothetical protein